MKINNFLPNHYCEIDYINKIIDVLSLNLDDNYSLYILYPDLKINNLKFEFINTVLNDNSKIKFAIHTGNEVYYDPTYYELFQKIFRYYLNDYCDYNKIYPISIGYNSSGNNLINMNPNIKLSNREIDVFFIGRNLNRSNFIESIKKLTNKNSFIKITDGFRQGLSINEYYEKLSNSKICLAPSGFSPETFRYVEGFGCGCIVITQSKNNSWYYDESPAIFVDNWDKVDDKFINNILFSDLDSIYIKNNKYYTDNLSPEANARYIINQLK
jgi:hypothetical protein